VSTRHARLLELLPLIEHLKANVKLGTC